MASNEWHEKDDMCSCEHCREPFTLVPLDLAVWNWREKLGLFTIESRIERLAQEASLYTVIYDPVHDEKDEFNKAEDKRIEGLLGWDEIESSFLDDLLNP